MNGLLFHVCSEAEWRQTPATGEYRGETLDTLGFIHCCTEKQLPGMLHRFRNRERLVTLVIDPSLLEAEVSWDQTPDGQRYPHIHGALNLGAVVEVRPAQGEFSPDISPLSDSDAPMPESRDRPAL